MTATSVRTRKLLGHRKTIRVKVCRLGGSIVERSGLPIGTKVGDLFESWHLIFGGLEPYTTIHVGREKVGLDHVLHNGDIVIVAPRILCGCNKVVRWKHETRPTHADILRALNEYLGDSLRELEYDHGLARWLCFLVGESKRFPDKPRSFKIFWEDGGIRTHPHEQDDFTKAVVDGFAALCEKKWNREPEVHEED